MRILHVIKQTDDPLAWQTVRQQLNNKENCVTVLLLHDAVFCAIQDGGEIYACQDDVFARGVQTSASLVDYTEIVEMLLEADSVVSW